MRLPRALILSALSLALSSAHGADLLSLYREAANQDPAVASAKASLQAARERVTQAEAANGFAAGINAVANANYLDLHVRTLPNAQTDRAYLAARVQVHHLAFADAFVISIFKTYWLAVKMVLMF